jgi:hypothetical protein
MTGVDEERESKGGLDSERRNDQIGGDLYIRGRNYKITFEEYVKHAALIHFYGHYRTEVEDILDQALVLSPPKPSCETNPASPIAPRDTERSVYLTFPEIFPPQTQKSIYHYTYRLPDLTPGSQKGPRAIATFCIPAHHQ